MMNDPATSLMPAQGLRARGFSFAAETEAAMDKPLVLNEVVDHIAVLTLDHPEKRNALSHAMLAQLKEHLSRIALDKQIHVVILRAAGPAFSAGHDLRELVGGNEERYRELFTLCS